MPSLSIVFVTARSEPEFRWLCDSVRRESDCPIIVIHSRTLGYQPSEGVTFRNPKPTVWSGAHRVTKQDWWSKSNFLNSGFCFCRTDWVMCVDDRSVLLPGWLDRVKAAMAGNYAVCGSYEKRYNLKVENGVIVESGTVSGRDGRLDQLQSHFAGATLVDCPGQWWFGCLNALPLEMVLAINGADETCDGSSMEDIVFGMMLKNAGFPVKFDASLALVEDRTPEKLGPVIRREDKGVSPNDKSHALLEMLRHRKTAQHPINLRVIRDQVLNGGEFPPPWGPVWDWWDQQMIRDF